MKTCSWHSRCLFVALAVLLVGVIVPQTQGASETGQLSDRKAQLEEELRSLDKQRTEVEQAMRLARNAGVDVDDLTVTWHRLHEEGMVGLTREIKELKQTIETLTARLKELVGEDGLAEEGDDEIDEVKALRAELAVAEEAKKDCQRRQRSLDRAFPQLTTGTAGGDKKALDRWRRLCREEEDRLRREASRVRGQVEQLRRAQTELLKASVSEKILRPFGEEAKAEKQAAAATRAVEAAEEQGNDLVLDWQRRCKSETVRLRQKRADVTKEIDEFTREAEAIKDAKGFTIFALDAEAMEAFPQHLSRLRHASSGLGDLADPGFVMALKGCVDELSRLQDEVRKLEVSLDRKEASRVKIVEDADAPLLPKLPSLKPRLAEQVEQLSGMVGEFDDRVKETSRVLRRELAEEEDARVHELRETEAVIVDIRKERGRIAEAQKELQRAKEANASTRMGIHIPAQIRRLRVLGEERDPGVEKALKKHDTVFDQLTVKKRQFEARLVKAEKERQKQTALLKKAKNNGDDKELQRVETDMAKGQKEMAKIRRDIAGIEDDLEKNAGEWKKLCEAEYKRLDKEDRDFKEQFVDAEKKVGKLKDAVKELLKERKETEKGRLETAANSLRSDSASLSLRYRRNMQKWEDACSDEEARLEAELARLEEELEDLTEEHRDLSQAENEAVHASSARDSEDILAAVPRLSRAIGSIERENRDEAFVNYLAKTEIGIVGQRRREERLLNDVEQSEKRAVQAAQTVEADRDAIAEAADENRAEVEKLTKMIEALSEEGDRWAKKSRDFELIIVPNRTDHYIKTMFDRMRKEEKLQPVYDGETVGDQVRGTLGGGAALKIVDRVLSARRPEDEDFREPVKVMWRLWEDAQGIGFDTALFDGLGKRLLAQVHARKQGLQRELAQIEEQLEKLGGKMDGEKEKPEGKGKGEGKEGNAAPLGLGEGD